MRIEMILTFYFILIEIVSSYTQGPQKIFNYLTNKVISFKSIKVKVLALFPILFFLITLLLYPCLTIFWMKFPETRVLAIILFTFGIISYFLKKKINNYYWYDGKISAGLLGLIAYARLFL